MLHDEYKPFVVPDEQDLTEFFGVEPSESNPADGFWAWEITDNRGVQLRFSYHLFERSVQTSLSVHGVPVTTVSHEGALSMSIDGSTLICEFVYCGANANLVLRYEGVLHVKWASLWSDA